jgi:hypothetical protein
MREMSRHYILNILLIYIYIYNIIILIYNDGTFCPLLYTLSPVGAYSICPFKLLYKIIIPESIKATYKDLFESHS